MKKPFAFQGVHTCDAIVITCMDFRFWESVVMYIKKDLGIESFDFPNLPGASKAFNDASEEGMPFDCVNIACNLHKVKKIIIVDHADCGAYGGSGKFSSSQEEQAFHEEALRKSKSRIKKKHPNKEVILLYIKLDSEQENIEIVRVREE